MKKSFFILPLMMMVFTSCTFLNEKVLHRGDEKKAEKVQKKETKQEVKKETTVKKKREVKVSDVRNDINVLIRNREFDKAVDMIKRELRSGQSELSFSDQYVASINGLIEHGIWYFYGNDCGLSGVTFKKALDNYPKKPVLKKKIKYSPDDIRLYMNACSEKLMEDGLFSYRDGNLGSAIKTWKRILRFDPKNSDAVKAIETATIQLQNLKKIE